MYNELISIIIPVFNMSPRNLIIAIESALNQTYTKIEIIICDDGSEILVETILNKYYGNKLNKLPIQVIRNNINKGISFARNIAINNSNGSWLIFLDGDDMLDKNCILNLYKESKEKILIIGNCYVFENKLVELRELSKIEKVAIANHKTIKDPFLLNITSLQPMMLKKDVFLTMNGFNEKYKIAELTELFLRFLFIYGIEKIGFASNAIYNYFRDNNSNSLTKQREKLFKTRLEILNIYKSKCKIDGELVYYKRDKKTGFQQYKLIN